jgi:hypothetical protein
VSPFKGLHLFTDVPEAFDNGMPVKDMDCRLRMSNLRNSVQVNVRRTTMSSLVDCRKMVLQSGNDKSK